MTTEVIKRGGKYCVQFSQGNQTFTLEGTVTKKDAVWMKGMLDTAFENFLNSNQAVREVISHKYDVGNSKTTDH